MKSTVIAVYDNVSKAESAIAELTKRGFGRSSIELLHPDASAAANVDQGTGHQDSGGNPYVSGTKVNLVFDSLIGWEYGGSTSDQDYHGDIYSEAMRRGHVLLAVRSGNDEQHAEIINVLDRYDPIDIDDRAEQWRHDGWLSRDDGSSRGAVRDNTPLDRMRANSASDHSLQDQHSDTLQPSTTRTDAGADYDTRYVRHGRVRSYPSRDDASFGSTESISDTQPQTFSDTNRTVIHESADDADYRTHWQSTYGHLGGRYEDHDPAYRYGSSLASNEQYRGRRWEDLEPHARTDWESRHAGSSGSTWEKAKDAVRHGWEKATR